MSDEPFIKAKNPNRSIWPKLTLILAIAFIMTAGAGFFFYKQYQNVKSSEEVERASLVEQLNKTVELPDEKPAIVTVEDKDNLSNQVLAARVENEDLLLIFVKNKRLVVYRPSSQKVIDMLTFASEQELPQASRSGDAPSGNSELSDDTTR